MNIPKNTEQLRNDVLSIRNDLRVGNLSNSVARTLLHGAKIALDSLRTEMDAAKLGCEFGSVELEEKTRKLRIVPSGKRSA